MANVKKLDFLHALYIAAIVISELMGSKTFPLWKLNASVAVFLLPVIFSINDIVFEVFGRERTISFVRSGLYVLCFLFAFTILAVVLPPSTRFEPSNSAYTLVFGKSLRIIFASLLAFGISDRLDVFVFSRIKEKMKNRSFWLRNVLSNTCSLFVDTVVFMVVAFYQQGNVAFLISLIIPYFLLKSTLSFLMTPVVIPGVKWLRGSDER